MTKEGLILEKQVTKLKPKKKEAWQGLEKHYHDIALSKLRIRDLFESDPDRFDSFSIELGDLLCDFSKQFITDDTLKKLCTLAESVDLKGQIQSLFAGDPVNCTEGRAALHTVLRDLRPDNAKKEVQSELQKMAKLVEEIHSGMRKGASGLPFRSVICLGIGGSELGPALLCEALDAYKVSDLKFYFISNVFGSRLAEVLDSLNPETTLCIVSSKTFSTAETLSNAKSVQQWFRQSSQNSENSTNPRKLSFESHFLAATAQPKRAIEFGIPKENIFEFWEWVGGRFSIWSAVGLPVMLKIGMPHFMSFLRGAHLVDEHFYKSEFERNIPVLMGLLGIWNSNFLNAKSHAILPYDDRLNLFPSYLQQLEMESNGKGVDKNLRSVQHGTAPVIWGGIGCNNQHAFMQLLHQGPECIPADFLIAAMGDPAFHEQQKLLVASCLSQSKALMEGLQPEALSDEDPLKAAKVCPGDRPSSTFFYSDLTPEILGMLIALYEHKVFVQGVIWEINSFDQFGVELGKELGKKIMPDLEKGEDEILCDSSTKGLIRFFQKNNNNTF